MNSLNIQTFFSMYVQSGSKILIAKDEELQAEIGKYSFIQEESMMTELPFTHKTDEYSELGIFKFELLEKLKDKPSCITIAADISLSMDDICADGRKKIQHAKQSLINIINYLHENQANVLLSILTFNTDVQIIVSKIHIGEQTEKQISTLIQLIENIRPARSTNISQALKTSTELMTNIELEFGQQYFFMLSDGEPTTGELSFQKMTKFLCPGAKNYYFGYGTGTAAHMQILANSIVDSKFIFIPHVEEAAMAFAEALDEALHAVVTKSFITIEHGELYDSLHNTWTTELYIGNLVKDKQRTFLFRTQDKKAVINIIQKEPDVIQLVDNCKCIKSTSEEPDETLSYECLRLHVIQLLHQTYESILLDKNNTIMKESLVIASLFLQTFMRQKGLLESEEYITLYNDVTISMQTLGTCYAELYCGSRLYTQVYESRYKSVIKVPEIFPTDRLNHFGLHQPFRRSFAGQHFDFETPELNVATPRVLMREQSLRRDTSDSQRSISNSISQGLDPLDEECYPTYVALKLSNTKVPDLSELPDISTTDV